jgi:hypothetical protein
VEGDDIVPVPSREQVFNAVTDRLVKTIIGILDEHKVRDIMADALYDTILKSIPPEKPTYIEKDIGDMMNSSPTTKKTADPYQMYAVVDMGKGKGLSFGFSKNSDDLNLVKEIAAILANKIGAELATEVQGDVGKKVGAITKYKNGFVFLKDGKPLGFVGWKQNYAGFDVPCIATVAKGLGITHETGWEEPKRKKGEKENAKETTSTGTKSRRTGAGKRPAVVANEPRGHKKKASRKRNKSS